MIVQLIFFAVVNTRKAGKGEISVAIDGGDVPCSLHPIGQHEYKATYVSTTHGTRTIEVLFNKVQVPGEYRGLEIMF